MADCKLTAGCLFFNDQMANMPGTAEIYKKKYCAGDYADCARYLVFNAIGRENVPKDLFPNQQEKVQHIIDKT